MHPNRPSQNGFLPILIHHCVDSRIPKKQVWQAVNTVWKPSVGHKLSSGPYPHPCGLAPGSQDFPSLDMRFLGTFPFCWGQLFFNSHMERCSICLNLFISARAVSTTVCPWLSTKTCRWDVNPGSGCRRWTIRILAICCVTHNLKFISQSSVLATHSHGIFIMMCNIVLHDSHCHSFHFERRKYHYLYHITLTLPRCAEPSLHLTEISSCPLPIFFSFKMYLF